MSEKAIEEYLNKQPWWFRWFVPHFHFTYQTEDGIHWVSVSRPLPGLIGFFILLALTWIVM